MITLVDIAIFTLYLLPDGFINDLNGVTRLMVYLGTMQPKTATRQLHYVHMPAANHHLSEAGSTVVLDNSMFRGQQQVGGVSTWA